MLKYIILGIIQGITEPLPISSSGHILIFKELFNTNMFNDLNFEIFVNFGSFIAIFLIFFQDIKKIVKDFFKYIISKKEDKKKYYEGFYYCLLIIIATMPVGLSGLIFKKKIESLAMPRIVGFALLVTSLSLLLVKNSNGQKEDKDIKIKDAIVIGIMEMFALFPGLSRSGMTLVGCLLCGLSKKTSLKFSFMLYFPVSIASFILGSSELISSNFQSMLFLNYAVGSIIAGFVTYFSYNWLSKKVIDGKLWQFAIYCIIAGIFTIIYFR